MPEPYETSELFERIRAEVDATRPTEEKNQPIATLPEETKKESDEPTEKTEGFEEETSSEEQKKEYSTEVDKDELRELVTQIIAFNVESYDELNALAGIPYEELQKMTPEQRHQKQIEMQERFNIPARKFFEDVATHHTGEHFYGIEASSNTPIAFNTTDLDGRGAVSLLRLAGADTKYLNYIKPGDHLKGIVNLDTSDHWGLVVGLPGEGKRGLSPEETRDQYLRKTIIIDHHGPDAPKNMSATKFTYKVLLELGMLQKTDVLDKTVELINESDNGRFPFDLYEKSDKIVAGLMQNMQFEKNQAHGIAGLTDLVEYLTEHGIEDINDIASTELNQANIDALGLRKAQEKKREDINKSVDALKEAEKNGCVVNSNYGKVVVDIGRYIKDGWHAIKCPTILGRASDTLIKWPRDRRKDKGFFISAGKDFQGRLRRMTDKEGLRVRGNMWLKENSGEPPETSLADILFTMGVPASEILKSRNSPDGRFNPKSLFAEVQREQDRTGKRPYKEVASYQKQ